MPIKVISDPIYNIDIHFIFDLPKNKAIPYLEKKWGINFEHHWDKAGFAYGEDSDYFIVLPDTKRTWDVSTILAHEGLHITSRVLRRKGLVLSDESEEAFTYYLTWILQALTDIYNQHKKAKTMKSKPNKSAFKKIKTALKKIKRINNTKPKQQK